MDKVVLRQDSASMPGNLTKRVQPFIDSGFLDLKLWNEEFDNIRSIPRLGEKCAEPQLLGTYSWIGFIDLDEFFVVFRKCAARCEVLFFVSCYFTMEWLCGSVASFAAAGLPSR